MQIEEMPSKAPGSAALQASSLVYSAKTPLQVGSVRFHFHFTDEETASEKLGAGPLARISINTGCQGF